MRCIRAYKMAKRAREKMVYGMMPVSAAYWMAQQKAAARGGRLDGRATFAWLRHQRNVDRVLRIARRQRPFQGAHSVDAHLARLPLVECLDELLELVKARDASAPYEQGEEQRRERWKKELSEQLERL